MAKSEIVLRLDQLQARLGKLLKPLGFRKVGRTFNRSTEPGLVQVVELGLGEVLPLPADLAEELDPTYGTTGVDLGVFVEEVYTKNVLSLPKRVIGSGACMIRQPLGQLDGAKHRTWRVKDDMDDLTDEIGSALLYLGIPFLDRFRTRQSIVDSWIAFNEAERRLSNVARLDVAMILLRRCDLPAAKQLMTDQVRSSDIPGHIAYVREVAARFGLGSLD